MSDNNVLPVTSPEEAGLDPDKLNLLNKTMQRYVDEGKVPNIVTLIARGGNIGNYEVHGYLDIDSRIRAGKDAIFRLYSNSKPIAGVAVMMLCEEGLLDLDDPVSKYIPAFKNPLVISTEPPPRNAGPGAMLPLKPAKREITIRDCLRHTTGLATPDRTTVRIASQYKDAIEESGWDLAASLDRPPRKTYLERVEAHAVIPLSFEPGTDFVYHAGFVVIGVIIEKVTGKTLEEFYQERIFKPLGMNDTSFYLGEGKLDRFTTCYQPSPEGGKWHLAVYDKAESSEKVKGPKVLFGAGGDMGGLLSTAADYARFGQMLLNEGELDGVRILSRKSVEIMTSNHTGDMVIPLLKPGFGVGMGVGVYLGTSPDPIMRSPGTFGWGGAAGTTCFVDPCEDLVAICFTQTFGHLMIPDNFYQEDFERLVYQALI
jgi:CubicO group peptidase (beta-lactamase class C family)